MNSTIVCVAYGQPAVLQAHSDCMLRLRVDHGALVLEIRESAHLDIVRSALATSALGHDADVVFFIDSDTAFDPGDVEKLADVARETRGVVGAPYSQRRMGGMLVGGIENTKDCVIYEGGGLYHASGAVGMGFTAIHADVLRRMQANPDYAVRDSAQGPCTPFFRKLVVDGRWLPEDASFCHTAREQGSPVDIDTRFRVTHWGLHGFQIEDCANKPDPARQIRLTR